METTDLLESTIEITGATTPAFDEILSPGALAFVEKLNATFGERRKELLMNRIGRQKSIDAGIFPGKFTVLQQTPNLIFEISHHVFVLNRQ